jgi:hypothetical protein
LCLIGGVFILHASTPTGPVAKELLQSKVGTVETLVAMVRLNRRDPARDARDDLSRNDYALYCTGTIGCSTPGLDRDDVPKGLTVHGTATAGCVGTRGPERSAYREAERQYLEAYNRAKVTALREKTGGPPAGIP